MKSIFFKLLLIALLAIPIYIYKDYFLQLEVFPGRQAMKVSPPPNNNDPYLNSLHKNLSNLEINELFWKRRINTKIPDVYTLVISLFDSLVWLDIDGVSIHESKIKSYKISADLISKRESTKIKAWLQDSYFLTEEWATVPKEPIRTKDLSGDRADQDSLDFKPFTRDSTDIMVVFTYSGDLKIGLKQYGLQSDNNILLEKQEIKKQNSEEIIAPANIQMSYTNLLQGDWISIEVPAQDAIAVYRALKINSQVILGL